MVDITKYEDEALLVEAADIEDVDEAVLKLTLLLTGKYGGGGVGSSSMFAETGRDYLGLLLIGRLVPHGG